MSLRHWLCLCLLVALGAGLVFFLVPGRETLAYMRLMNHDYEPARRIYEELLQEGRTSGSVLLPLVELALQSGDLDKAEKVMRLVVKEHPRNADALRRLGTILQFGGKLPDYVEVLETLADLDPREREMLDLCRALHFLGQYEREIAARRKLIAKAPARAAYHDELARLQAALGHWADAASTLRQLQAVLPDAFTRGRVLLLANLLLDSNDAEGALRLAEQRIGDGRHLDEAANLTSLFNSKNRFDLAVRLISPWYEKALAANDERVAGEIPDWILLEMANSAREQNRLEFARQSFAVLGRKYAKGNDSGPSSAKTGLTEAVDALGWPAEEKAALASFWIQLGDFEKAFALLIDLGPRETTPEWALNDLVFVSQELGRTREALPLFEQLRLRRPGPAVAAGWSRLAARQGREAEVVEWLRGLPAPEPEAEVLHDLADIAGAAAQTNLLLETSARLLAHTGADPERRLRVEALLTARRNGEALELSRDLRLDLPDGERTRLDALWASLRGGGPVREELENFARPRLSRRGLDPEMRRDLADALAEAGSHDLALPVLRALADEGGADREDAYQTALAAAGRKDELRDRWREIAARPATEDDHRRNLAFDLLDLGDKEGAERIFRGLALLQTYGSQDARDLLFLWGPRPDGEQLRWLEGRARAATSGPERAGWLRHLANAGGSRQVVDWVSTRMPAGDATHEVISVFLDALVDLADARGLDNHLGSLDMNALPPETLHAYAAAASALGLSAREESLDERILYLDPQNVPVRRDLGLLAFRRKDYESAKRWLQPFTASSDCDPLIRHALGQIARAEGDDPAANLHFESALQTLEAASTMDARLLRARILRDLGKNDQSLALLRDLVETNPGFEQARQEYEQQLSKTGRAAPP